MMFSRQSCAQCADMLRLAFKPQPQRYCAPNSACPVGRRGAVSSRHASTSASAPATSISTSTPPPKKSSNRKLLRDLKNEPANSPSSPISHIANSLQSRASRTTETYTAFGATKKMFEACQLQADYKIPQASQLSGVVPKTAHGEDLGVGEGAWYKGLLVSSNHYLPTKIHLFRIFCDTHGKEEKNDLSIYKPFSKRNAIKKKEKKLTT
ncbi:ubiquinol-cytochrome C chaperone [Histoplasma ohiense]|nr:ubiquinol-cytochrome C chaperone [Histoplasma ohiense (nom. inval.)]